MPASLVGQFTDPAEYAAAIVGTDVEMVVTMRGQFAARLTRVELHALRIQGFSDNLPRVAHAAANQGRATISFRTSQGPDLQWDRQELRDTNILRHGRAHNAFQRSAGASSFVGMSLPRERMAELGEAVCGCDLSPPGDGVLVTPPPAAFARLRSLYAAAVGLAEHAPAVIAHQDAARGLEQALSEAMVICLSDAEADEESIARRRHATIMRRFHAVLAERADEAIYVPELCAAVGVPRRTLTLCCEESLGMGPKRFLLLRRMHLVRHVLRMADPRRTTVADAASSFGFWNFGRFAVEYRSLFGERPSATLAAQP